MNARETKALIKKLSAELGFVEAGVVLPKRPAHYDKFLYWLSEGHAADMSYLETERARACREDPSMLFPECKSIITLLARYPSPVNQGDIQRTVEQGKVAAYAWGEDYHTILVGKLNQLVSNFQAAAGRTIMSMAVTDSVPLLERELAQSAGLGWIGKNSCLISPRHGSFTFIAELLVDVQLAPDEKRIPDHCGTCQRCVDACPTRCILPDRTIQAERCISYLTIENRGDISTELRPLMGNWVFGCDICQSVCPWNRKPDDKLVDGGFKLHSHLKKLDLVNELALSEEGFKRIFKCSPISRTRRRGYLRNIALVLGNQRDLKAVNPLIQVMKCDPDPVVRTTAVWSLSKFGSEQIELELQTALAGETNISVRDEINQALKGIGGK
ncbi:MAG: tRNA epoxyqueuosine(34) reductase QueG [Anaerolineaceae bacterium]